MMVFLKVFCVRMLCGLMFFLSMVMMVVLVCL